MSGQNQFLAKESYLKTYREFESLSPPLLVCLRSSVGLEHPATNGKVIGSSPIASANVIARMMELVDITG